MSERSSTLEPNRRILIVDDNQAIHDDILKILGSDGGQAQADLEAEEAFLFGMNALPVTRFEIDSAYQGQEGLEKVKDALANGRPYSTVFVDIRMPPGWDGVETIGHLWDSDPALQVVICTAYSDYSWNDMRRKFGNSDSLLILKKPFDNIEATQLAHALARKWTVTRQAELQTAELKSELARRARMERDLQASQERYALAARGANDGIWDWDFENLAIYFAPRWKEMVGFREEEIEARSDEWLNRVHPCDRERLLTQLEALRKIGGPNDFTSEYRIRHKDGTYRWMLNRAGVLRSPEGGALRMVGSQTDVTANKVFDTLTGLPNRLHFAESIATAIEMRTNGSSRPFSVMFIDLDRFKDINDSLGHLAGDQLLLEVARRLKQAVHAHSEHGSPAADLVARLGGDEFGILIEDVRDPEQALALAAGVAGSLRQPLSLKGSNVAVNASIGIILWNKDYTTPQEMLRDADTAMYRAKHLGRNQAALFDAGMHAEMMDRLQLKNDLRFAVSRGELIVEYQPIFELSNTGGGSVGRSGMSYQRLVGFEALVRWLHPSRGLLMPAQFIFLAEETGLIVPLGEFVLREACATMERWHRRWPGEIPLDLAVNLSPYQLRDPQLLQRVDAALKQTGLDPGYLKLEITESVLVDDSPFVLQTLKALDKMGIMLGIDDFGTGYSCLSYLPLLPCRSLKLDRSFVMRMHKDIHSFEIVRAILALAKTLNMYVIAEGIESRVQLDLLRNIGCRFGQGFYFSPPLSRAAAQQLVEARAAQCYPAGTLTENVAG